MCVPDPGAMVTPGMRWMDFATCPHEGELSLLTSVGLDPSAPWRFSILISLLLHGMWLRYRFPGASFYIQIAWVGASQKAGAHLNTQIDIKPLAASQCKVALPKCVVKPGRSSLPCCKQLLSAAKYLLFQSAVPGQSNLPGFGETPCPSISCCHPP